MILLAGLFLLTALLYAAAGFGGGSTYTALLVLAGTDFRAVPIMALACNILVVSVGTWRFSREGHFDWRRAWPLFVLSIPAAWLGGRLMIGEVVFIGLLALSLLVAGLLMLWQPYWQRESVAPPAPRLPLGIELAAGGILGFLAGVVGIGGGIFLAPLLYLLRWGAPRAIAATCAAFILVNSIAGLIGQASKGLGAAGAVVGEHAILFPAVVVGGFIGSSLGARRIDPKWVRVLTALLILYVAVRLALRFAEAVR